MLWYWFDQISNIDWIALIIAIILFSPYAFGIIYIIFLLLKIIVLSVFNLFNFKRKKQDKVPVKFPPITDINKPAEPVIKEPVTKTPPPSDTTKTKIPDKPIKKEPEPINKIFIKWSEAIFSNGEVVFNVLNLPIKRIDSEIVPKFHEIAVFLESQREISNVEFHHYLKRNTIAMVGDNYEVGLEKIKNYYIVFKQTSEKIRRINVNRSNVHSQDEDITVRDEWYLKFLREHQIPMIPIGYHMECMSFYSSNSINYKRAYLFTLQPRWSRGHVIVVYENIEENLASIYACVPIEKYEKYVSTIYSYMGSYECNKRQGLHSSHTIGDFTVHLYNHDYFSWKRKMNCV